MTDEERKHYEVAQRLIAEAKATGATELDLSGLHKLTIFPPELAKLTTLADLSVRSTQITNFKPLAKLPNLMKLYVSNTDMTDLKPLANLTALTSLDCWSTKITDLTPLAKLTAITVLDASSTKITDLTPLAKLTTLTELRLRDCTALTHLGLPEAMLARLAHLSLYNCVLTDLPHELCQRGAWTNNVAREVHAYIRGLREQGSAMLNECKLIVLGNGRAGKTSAIKALQRDPFDPKEESTHAIRFWMWTRSLAFAPGGAPEQARVNVWDFGGQDIYHQAHRLFLRTRAVFLVCWNPWEKTAALREDGDEPRALTYWLEQIHALHRDPRVLILRTHADCDAAELAARGITKVPDWRDIVPAKYRKLQSLALGAAAPDARTVKKIHKQLDAAFIAEMSAGSRAVPAGWAAVRTRLNALSAENEAAFRANQRPPHAVLSEQEFTTLVDESLAPGVTARDPAEARSFLHDIGALFYDKRLGGRVVLDQRWCIEGIYAALRRGPLLHALRRHGGPVSASDLAAAWSATGYTKKEQDLLLEFMQACGQAVEIMRPDETLASEAVYLLPALLPTAQELATRQHPEPKGERTYFGGWAGPELGADVAQAFIVAAAKQFLRGGRYWRWGVEVTSAHIGATARVQWNALDAWGYGGQIHITLWGPPERAAKLGGAIFEQLRRFIPAGASDIAGKEPAQRDSTREAEPLLAVADSRKTAQGRRLTFSLAGADTANPDLEGAPEALYQALAGDAQNHGWAVFSYRHSTDEPDIAGLLKHVGTGDYVVIFLSRKYLRSRYCMEELRLAYASEPPGFFPPDNVRIFGLGDWRPRKDEEWRAMLADWKRALDDWRQSFLLDVMPFAENAERVAEEYKRVPALGWFKLCGDAGALQNFTSTLRGYVADAAPLPFINGDMNCETWLAKWTAEISERLK